MGYAPYVLRLSNSETTAYLKYFQATAAKIRSSHLFKSPTCAPQRKKDGTSQGFRPLISQFHYLKYFTPLSNSFRSCSPVMFFAT